METISLTCGQRSDPRIERTRAAVIDAASTILTEEGPSAVTHAAVAAAAGVSRTTMYKHWPTQADLLRDTIDSLGHTVVALEDLIGPLSDDLAHICAHLVTDLADDQRAPMIANMMERALHDPDVVAVRDDFLAQFEDVFHHVVTSAIDRGELRADIDVRRAMASLIGGFLFTRFMSNVTFDAQVAAALIDDFVTVNSPR